MSKFDVLESQVVAGCRQVNRNASGSAGPWVRSGGACDGGRARFARGDVVVRRVSFSSAGRTRRTSKRRPCIVMEVLGGEMRVRPVYGANSAVRRQGLGRRIHEWSKAGFTKPCIVSCCDLWIPAAGHSAVGRLGAEDYRRLVESASLPL